MAEAGGPTTHAGIFYQNTIAGLYLGRMLDLRQRAARDRVIRVRLEAPEAVDDLVAEMGDGSRAFLQVKLDISVGSDAWVALWRNFKSQMENPSFASEDHVRLVLGTHSQLAAALRGASERATTANDVSEWQRRLTEVQKRVVRGIADTLDDLEDGHPSVWRILTRSAVEVIPDDTIERDYTPLWMPESGSDPKHLLSALRDIAGGASRIRAHLDAPTLRIRLLEDCGIKILEPTAWGAAAYRETVINSASVVVPGASQARPVADAFLWPHASRYDKSRQPDFDDEIPRSIVGVRTDDINLRDFGSFGLDKVVVVAGPGMGKSQLVVALSYRAAMEGRLPVVVSIPELSRLDLEIASFLEQEVNPRFQISVDWHAAAESGLLEIYLDGLDEVATSRRAVILERIRRFSGRFPRVAWLLTVRDAAALAAPTEATLVELELLSDDQIHRFLELTIKDDAQQVERLRRRIDASPDLRRLARIPLFLALLITTVQDRGYIPKNRTELLEGYLDLLFRPEQYKGGGDAEPDPFMLRGLAEAVAFQALEREEIGFDARLASAVILERVGRGAAVDTLIQRWVRCGVVRRVGPRLEFPFPVVQEYLAACEILSHRLPEITARLVSAIKRPWAQTLQFVLEQHPHPEKLVVEMLSARDDAFHTNLRLLARSIANGMRVDADTRAQITERLVRLWRSASWQSATRIGELLADAFTDPLVPELRAELGKSWRLHQGGGAIVFRISDPLLTRAVLQDLLNGNIDHLLNLYEAQEPVNALGDEALSMYIARARQPRTTRDEQHSLAVLIRHLDGQIITRDLQLAVALDETLDGQIRLAAFGLSRNPIDERAIPLIGGGLTSEDWRWRSVSMDLLPAVPDSYALLRSVLLRDDMTIENRIALLDYLPSAIQQGLPKEHLAALVAEPRLDPALKDRLLVFSARWGDETAMEILITTLGTRPVEIIGAAVSLFGYHRSRRLAALALDALRERQFSSAERVRLAWSIVLGMTGIYEMLGFDYGGIKSAPPHPGSDLLLSLLEEWAEIDDYDLEQAMKLDMELVLLGSRNALERLPSRIEAVFRAGVMDLTESQDASTFGNALRVLHENYRFLPLGLLEQIILDSSWNVLLSAGPMITAYGSREAFDTLLRIYEAASNTEPRAYLLDLLEPLAGRLGLRVWSIEGHIEVRTN